MLMGFRLRNNRKVSNTMLASASLSHGWALAKSLAYHQQSVGLFKPLFLDDLEKDDVQEGA